MTRIVSIGECMIELSGRDGVTWKQGFAGDTLNTAWYARALLDADKWRVGYFTRLGQDGFSQRMTDFIAANGIETRWISRDPHRNAGLYAIELKDGERSFTYWRENSSSASSRATSIPLIPPPTTAILIAASPSTTKDQSLLALHLDISNFVASLVAARPG